MSYKTNKKQKVLKWALLSLLLFLCPSAWAAPAVTVSASSITLLGTTQTISLTCTLIDPNTTGMLRVSGGGVISVLQTSTVTPGTTATCGPIYGNDVIIDGFGNVNSTYYKVQVFTVDSSGIIASTPVLQNFYAFTGSGTVDLVTATPLAPSFMTGTNGSVTIPGNLTTLGNGTHSGTETFANINNTVYLDGVTYTTLAACYAAIPSAGGTCVVPPNYSETLSANVTMNKSGSGFLFMGAATITMGTHQVIVPGATYGVFIKSSVPFGGGLFSTTTGPKFIYTGSGKAFQIGDGASTTDRVFTLEDITVDLTGASSGASGFYLTNLVYFTMIRPVVIGNNATTGTFGIVCDGTGNFCGTGTILNPYFANLGTGILGTGTVGNGANALVVLGGTVGCQTNGIGLDFEIADSSSVLSMDVESCATAVKFGANAAGNFIRIRQEANTTDFQAIAGSQQNVGQVERGNAPVVSDAGTHNHFYRMQDGDVETLFADNVQSRSGGNTNFIDRNSVIQAATVPNAFEVLHTLALASGTTIQDASSGIHAGLTLKKGSGAGNYTTASTTYAVADSTNLCYTVIIPTGWKLGISASGAIGTATAAVSAQAALTDNAACSTANSGILVETTETTTAAGVLQPWALNWIVTGDGNSHNIALQYKTSNAADSATLQNSSATALPTIKFELMPSN